MKRLLFCSQESLLVKGLYGLLRDEGFLVDHVEHPSEAVRQCLCNAYDAVILDTRDIGLSALDAASIIRTLKSDIKVFLIGGGGDGRDAMVVNVPLDSDELKRLLADSLRSSVQL